MNLRQSKILELLEEESEVSVDHLVTTLQASEATIRRDLTILEKNGMIIRSYGGARLAPSSSLVARTFAAKRQMMRMEKERIAERAAKLVEPGMTLIIDSGTTAWRFAANLKEKAPLTIFTCALPVIEELGEVQGITIHGIGGRFRLENLDFIGNNAVCAFQKLHSDIAFIGADSFIPEQGVFSVDPESAAVGEAMAQASDKIVILSDSSKFKLRGYHKLVNENEISVVITDDNLDSKTKKQMQKTNLELIVI